MKPISEWGWLGGHDGQRPMRKFGQDAGVTPQLFFDRHTGIFNDHRESGPRFNVSSEGRCFFTVKCPRQYHWGIRTPNRPQGEHPLLASLTPLPTATQSSLEVLPSRYWPGPTLLSFSSNLGSWAAGWYGCLEISSFSYFAMSKDTLQTQAKDKMNVGTKLFIVCKKENLNLLWVHLQYIKKLKTFLSFLASRAGWQDVYMLTAAGYEC